MAYKIGNQINAPVICDHCLPPPTGKGEVTARLNCRAITSSVPAVQGKLRGFDIRILTPGRFFIAKGRTKRKVLTSSLPSGGGAFNRALKADKL